IQMMLRNVLDNPVGNEVPDRVSCADALTTGCRRDRQRRNFQLADVLTRQSRSTQNVSGAGNSDEMCQVPQFIMVSPAENLRYGVRSRDEEELRIRALRRQIAESVDRVGR